MIRNYLIITLRNLNKNRSYVLINTFGLGIALACCITAYLLIAYNHEFDNFFEDEDVNNIYRVHTNLFDSDGDLVQHVKAPINLGPAMVNDLAGVQSFTRFMGDQGFVRFEDNSFTESVAFADSNFYDLFKYPLVEGNLSSFQERSTVVLDKQTADKYFGDKNPIGQILTFNFANQTEISGVVGAVVDKIPLNSSMVFGVMIRIEHFMDIYDISTSKWDHWRDPALFVQLTNADIVNSYRETLAPYVALRNDMFKDFTVDSFQLYQFKSAMNQDDTNWSIINLRISNMPLIIFSVMALMILLTACFNLTNTSIAITTKRFKEVGVRKVIGASRFQIIFQFLFEMVISIVLALTAGLILSKFIVAEFASMWNLQYGLEDLNGLNLFVTLISLVFLSCLLAGLYPALLNSRFKPVILLKGSVRSKGTNFFTRFLVMIQFALSMIVLINGLVFIQNTDYQESIDYGYAMDNIVSVSIRESSEYEILNNRVSSNPMISETAITHHVLGAGSYAFPVKIDTTDYQAQHVEVGENFLEIMDLKLVEGRFIDMNNTTDATNAVVVNTAFLEKVNMTEPLNKTIEIRETDYRIVGVVNNHVDNLFRSKEPEPFVYYGSKPNEYQMMLIKASPENLGTVQDYLEEVWMEEFPEKPFRSSFQEDLALGGLRQTNGNLKKIFIFLTILGGLLSASGIFAIASLNVEKRTKEIGIRKALGATVKGIVTLLSRGFVYILTIAALIGIAGGYLLTSALLDQIYAYHIKVGPAPLIVAIVVLCGIGIGTTSSIIFRAASANPVLSLRDE